MNVIFCLLTLNVFALVSSKPEDIRSVKRLGVDYLGRVGQKLVYLVDEQMDWWQARNSCRSSGMQGLEISTPTERDFLATKLPATGPIYSSGFVDILEFYWTAGKYQPDITHFMWEMDPYHRIPVKPTGMGIVHPDLLCLAYSRRGTLWTYSCNRQFHVLCQITTDHHYPPINNDNSNRLANLRFPVNPLYERP